MNYAGFDIYAHNKATARFGRHVDARSLVPSTVAIDCPFCGKAITANGGTLAEHSERFWSGRCPVSGYTVEEARRMAADAVEARVEMERNTPVMVMLGPDGRPAATAPMGVVRWWRN